MLRPKLISMLATMSLLRANTPPREDSGDLGGLASILTKHNLTTFTSLLDKYPEILSGIEKFPQFTVIAPSNEAFLKAPDLDLSNATQVTELLRYHILQDRVAMADLELGTPVFAPTLLAGADDTSDTSAAAAAQRITVIRQSADEVVLVTGGDSRSVVGDEDVPFRGGGLVQVVGTLLVPPRALAPTVRAWFPDLQAFLGALYATGLVGDVGLGPAAAAPVTVFAPRDAAFQRVAGALGRLAPAELRDVLAYHVVPGELLYSPGLRNGSHWPTLAGARDGAPGEPVGIWLTAAGNNRYVDSSQILDPDILIANGVVHMIADVLNPLRSDATPIPGLPVQSPVFEPIGTTTVGHGAPVPFVTALPCTADCPTTTTTTTTTTTATARARHTPVSSAGAGAGGPGRGGAAVAAGLVGLRVMGMLL